jgi:hypothetical protein
MKTFAAFTIASLALLSAAQAAGTTYRISDVCRYDMQQYCKGMKAAQLRDLRACLAKHESDLLPRCQDHYKEAIGH